MAHPSPPPHVCASAATPAARRRAGLDTCGRCSHGGHADQATCVLFFSCRPGHMCRLFMLCITVACAYEAGSAWVCRLFRHPRLHLCRLIRNEGNKTDRRTERVVVEAHGGWTLMPVLFHCWLEDCSRLLRVRAPLYFLLLFKNYLVVPNAQI